MLWAEVCRARFFPHFSRSRGARVSHACVADAGDNENLSESLWKRGSCELRNCKSANVELRCRVIYATNAECFSTMSSVKVRDYNERICKALKCGDLEEVGRILQSNPECLGYVQKLTDVQSKILAFHLPSYTDENGWTPMHLAAYWNKGECLRLFIAHALRHGVDADVAANRYRYFP